MEQPHYFFQIRKNVRRYDFVSEGHTRIPKAIQFFDTSVPDLFNLVLGDVRPDGQLDVFSVSDNGDRDKVLATVAQVVAHFLQENPTMYVFFTGSTPARTRLYRMAVGHEFTNLVVQFEIMALLPSKQLVPFQPNLSCDGFVISLKNPNVTE